MIVVCIGQYASWLFIFLMKHTAFSLSLSLPCWIFAPKHAIILYPGAVALFNLAKYPEGVRVRIFTAITIFIMSLVTVLRSVTNKVTKRLTDDRFESDSLYGEFPQESQPKEEFRPPSPSPGYTEKDLLSSVLRRLGELEEKVNMLESKPSEMPSEKEELLEASVRRVDALEAELISTKKVRVSVIQSRFSTLIYFILWYIFHSLVYLQLVSCTEV